MNSIRAKLCQAQNPFNNTISKNETMEDRDSTGILPVECHNLQDLVSLHFICLRKVGIGCVTSLENRPAGLSRPAPAQCDGPGVAIVAIITSDVLVPVIGRARGGLGFG